MKINEIVTNTSQKIVGVQPTVLKKQARVGSVVTQIAASDAKQAPTEIDKVQAMWAYSEWKKRIDKAYAKQLKQQLAAAEPYAK